jgi:hypothetical protein
MEKIERKDPLTGQAFIPKRSNQRFATSYNRKKFNNQIANDLRKEREYIIGPLNRKHGLFKKLMTGKHKAVFSYEYIDGYGLDFNTITHHEIINDIQVPCFFEFAIYLDGISKTVKIVRYGRL